jgi:hypothetical protein
MPNKDVLCQRELVNITVHSSGRDVVIAVQQYWPHDDGGFSRHDEGGKQQLKNNLASLPARPIRNGREDQMHDWRITP